jgi:hypothetical protein
MNVVRAAAMLETAFSGHWDYKEISRVTDRLDSSKMFFINLVLARCGLLKNHIDLYQSFNDALFDTLESHGGFIDSSKMPARLYFLSYDRICPYSEVIWFVRDPRGVAWSCMKDVERPEAQSFKDAKMPRFGFFSSIFKWIINTCVSSFVSRRINGVALKKYEDLGKEFSADSQPLGAGIELIHSVSGNPRRFNGGLQILRLDEEWRQKLNFWQIQSGKVLCWPWMRGIYKKNVPTED